MNNHVSRWHNKMVGVKEKEKPRRNKTPHSGASLYGTLAEEGGRLTPTVTQREVIPGREREMARNSAGGAGFIISPETMLDRFLIIGSETPTYYASARELTLNNTTNILNMIRDNGEYVVRRIVEISKDHRAYRNDAALYALALAASNGNQIVRNKAMYAVQQVARNGGDFLKIVDMIDKMRGHGNQFNNMLRHWYNDKDAEEIAYQTLKYQQASGWTHRDVLRLARPKPHTAAQEAIYHYIVKGLAGMPNNRADLLPDRVKAWEVLKAEADEESVIKLIEEYKLTWEFVPNERRSVNVWKVLGMQMPLGTTLRYVSNLSRHNIFDDRGYMNEFIERITNPHWVMGAKLHPIRAMMAHAVYRNGSPVHGESRRGWKVYPEIVEALENVFKIALRAPEPTGKRILIGLDVSSSMNTSFLVNNQGEPMPITAREVSAAMSLAMLHSDDNVIVGAFSDSFSRTHGFGRSRNSFNTRNMNFSIMDDAKSDSLTRFIQRVNGSRFGATDCALPMRYAMENNIPVDAFVIWTDNESWAGDVHPSVALTQYRDRMGIDAKLVVCACTATRFSVADPRDWRQMDVVGFDANAANVIADFIRNDW